jgi:hypothetical protein
MIFLMGIQASPAFSMLAIANKNPRSFPLQQVKDQSGQLIRSEK